MEKILLFGQIILRIIAVILGCLTAPLTKYHALKKRKRVTPIRNKILLVSATELARRIRNKEVTSVEVVKAFIERCNEVNPLLNAIVESRFDAAIEEARNVDNFLKTTSKSPEELAEESPLLGLPITVKQSLAVKGMSHAVGVKENIHDRANRDAAVIEMIRKAGGIIILISNTPEFCMSYETYNRINGITRNPYDLRKVSGGSSGGEAALLGSGASILGIGSDIGGSARLPAMFCGIFGHKPTPCMVPWEGHRPESPEKEWPYFFTPGSMVRYAEDLPLFLKAITSSPEARKALDQEVSLKDVKVFYAEHDGSYLTPSVNHEIIAAMRKLKQHLELKYNISVQKPTLSELRLSFNLATTALLSLEEVETIFNTNRKNKKWRSVTLESLKFICLLSDYTFSAIFTGIIKKISEHLPKSYFDEMEVKRDQLKKKFEELLGDNGVLIYPTYTNAACYPSETHLRSGDTMFMMIFNALGFPVTQCPLGLNSAGLPVGVQIVANPGRDHLTLAMAREIQKAFGGWQPPTERKVSQLL